VTQATIHATICQRGYTAKVRPPRKVTDTIKRRLINGLPGYSQDYELDHLIPLGLGGHPTSSNNLWLQNWPEAAIKDRDELRLHREVCSGRMTLEQAQHDMGAVVMTPQRTTSVESPSTLTDVHDEHPASKAGVAYGPSTNPQSVRRTVTLYEVAPAGLSSP